MTELSQPIRFLRDAGGYYTIAELAERVNMPVVDVKSAVLGALRRGEIETRKHKGSTQVRWPA